MAISVLNSLLLTILIQCWWPCQRNNRWQLTSGYQLTNMQGTNRWILNSQGLESLSPRISLATGVSLHVCCWYFSLVSDIEWMGMLWICYYYAIEIFYSIGHFYPWIIKKLYPPKLYCLTLAMILYNNSVSVVSESFDHDEVYHKTTTFCLLSTG